MLKQKSQESFIRVDNNKSVTSIPYIDASPPSSNGLGLSVSKASFGVTSPSHKGKKLFFRYLHINDRVHGNMSKV